MVVSSCSLSWISPCLSHKVCVLIIFFLSLFHSDTVLYTHTAQVHVLYFVLFQLNLPHTNCLAPCLSLTLHPSHTHSCHSLMLSYLLFSICCNFQVCGFSIIIGKTNIYCNEQFLCFFLSVKLYYSNI